MIVINKYIIDKLVIQTVLLEIDDLEKIIYCKDQVIKAIKDSSLFIPPSNAYIETILKGYGKIIGLTHNNTLVAFASIVFPRTGKNNLGNYLNFSKAQLTQVVQFEHGLVIDKYRGHGFLKILLEEVFHFLEPQYSLLLSTVSPYNISSLKTAFKVKQVIKAHIFYHGYERFILYRNFKEPLTFPEFNILTCTDIEELDYYLKQNYIALFNFDEKYYILRRQ